MSGIAWATLVVVLTLVAHGLFLALVVVPEKRTTRAVYCQWADALDRARHIFKVMTRHPKRMADYLGRFQPDSADPVRYSQLGGWVTWDGLRRDVGPHLYDNTPVFNANRWPLPNVRLGAICSTQAEFDERVPLLVTCPAAVRVLYAVPLLGPLNVSEVVEPECCVCGGHGVIEGNHCPECYGRCSLPSPIHHVVCGGESGDASQPVHPDWVRRLRDQCLAADVTFWFTGWD